MVNASNSPDAARTADVPTCASSTSAVGLTAQVRPGSGFGSEASVPGIFPHPCPVRSLMQLHYLRSRLFCFSCESKARMVMSVVESQDRKPSRSAPAPRRAPAEADHGG